MAGRSFELQRALGDGAFGTVYLADMVSLGGFRKSVALKLLKPDWDAASDAARRLRDEARLLGRLRHRHIVQVDDLIRLDGRWAVVMEYVPGVDLERLVGTSGTATGPVPPVAALEITAAVAQALDAAFNGAGDEGEPLRVVHRDIKPSNIRLTAAGDVKVLDFGIARADFAGREARTDKVRYGSLGYMAPERLLGDPEVPAGDVFAVGAVLYELLCGQPFGRVKLAPEKAEQQLQANLAVAAEALPEAAGPALELVADCMAYEVEHRPTSSEVATRARAIARTLDGEDLFAYAARAVPVLQSTAAGAPVERRLLTEEVDSATFALDGPADSPVATAVPPASEPTLALDGGSAQAVETLPVDSGGLSRGAIAGAVAALVVVTLLGSVALFALVGDTPGRLPSPGTAQAPPEPTVVVAAPAPDPEPTAADPELPPAADPPAAADPPPAADPPAAADPAPVSDPSPTDDAVATAEPAPVAPPTTAPQAAPASPTATQSTPPPTQQVDRVKFHVPGASRISATCGGVGNSSTSASVNLLRFPAGPCRLEATVDGTSYQHTLQVTRPNGYTCTPTGEQLSCTSQL